MHSPAYDYYLRRRGNMPILCFGLREVSGLDWIVAWQQEGGGKMQRERERERNSPPGVLNDGRKSLIVDADVLVLFASSVEEELGLDILI